MRRSLVLWRLPLVMIAPLLVFCAVFFLAPASKRAVFLGDRADFFIDSSGVMPAGTVMAEAQRLFTPSNGRFVNRGVEGGPRAQFWLRITVPDLSAIPGEPWVLSVQETRVRDVGVFILRNGHTQVLDYAAGAVDPAAGIVPRYATFTLPGEQLSGAELFIRIYTRSSRRAVIWLEPQPAFQASDHRQTLFFSLLFGVQIALFVYLLAQGLALREPSLIALATLVASYLTHVVADRAFLESVVWPGAILASRILSFAMTFASYAAWLWFLLLYLRVREWSRWFGRLLVLFIGLNVLLTAVTIVEPIVDVSYVRPFSAWFGLASSLLGLATALAALWFRTSRAVLFLACWLPTILGTLSRLFLDVGPTAAGGLTTVYAVYAGVAGSLLAFSIVLSLDIQHREIGLRRMAEESADRFQGFATASSDSFWETDAAGRLTVATGDSLALIGAAPGRAMADCLSGLDSPVAGQEKPQFDRPASFRNVMLGLGVFPARRVFELSGAPRMVDGAFAGFYGTMSDVTEREDQRHRFEQRARLASVGQLTSSLAHDINNLLHPIINLSRRLRDRLASDEEGRSYLQTVLEAGERASGIVSGVLGGLQLGRGETPLLPLTRAVAETVATLRRILDGRARIVFEAPSGDGPEVALSDVYQVLSNLAGNAIAASDGPAEIHIRLMTSPEGGVRLAVSDRGCGMDGETLARASEPLFTSRPGEGGTGLGLAIVRSIAERWHATFSLASEPGEGTDVVIDFPVPSQSNSGGAT